MRILVTGASGFVGRRLCSNLIEQGHEVIAVVRQQTSVIFENHESLRVVIIDNINAETDWRDVLDSAEVVVHLAARVHVMNETLADAWKAYRKINVGGTERLARAAAIAKVKLFVFLSSIKVNGEVTQDQPFSSQSAVNPQDPYAVSKWEAEQVLQRISDETGMEVVILRPPLVYGPGVKANYLCLLHWIDRGIPLPLASVDNRRSMIYLGNLVDAMIACIQNPLAVGKTYLISDGEDVSTPDLIRQIANSMHKPDYLWRCPEVILRGVARLAAKSSELDRLLSSLQVDSSKIREDLHWVPPYSLEQGIAATVEWFQGSTSIC